jgi:hypothetical protein
MYQCGVKSWKYSTKTATWEQHSSFAVLAIPKRLSMLLALMTFPVSPLKRDVTFSVDSACHVVTHVSTSAILRVYTKQSIARNHATE